MSGVRRKTTPPASPIPQNGMLERMIRATEDNAANGALMVDILRELRIEVRSANDAQAKLLEAARRTEEKVMTSEGSVKQHLAAEIKAQAPHPLVQWILAGAATVIAGALAALVVIRPHG